MDQIATYEFLIGQGFSKERAKLEVARLGGNSGSKTSVKTDRRLARLNTSCRRVYDSLKSLGGTSSVTAVWENMEGNYVSHQMVRYYLHSMESLDLLTIEYKGGRNVFTLVA